VTERIGRRGLVLAGLAGAAGACAPHNAEPPGDSTAPGPSPDSASLSSATTSAQPTNAQWKQLAKSIKGTLARPGSAGYDTVRLTQNPRYDGAQPLAVLSVASAGDVATAIAFAKDHALPVAVRSGGHSYPGWSAGNNRLVIDVRPLHRVKLLGTTAHLGAGASLVDVYAGLGAVGRGIAGGSCPTVGIAGLTQGGGVGVLTRAHGLTCDAVTAMKVVTADGTVRTVDANHDPDLFWALRGGGGGHLGVVTSFTMHTFVAPTISTVYLAWPFSEAAQVVPAWLASAPTADRRLWSTMKLLGGSSHQKGPVLFLSATWVGDPAKFAKALQPLLKAVPTPTSDVSHVRSYLDTMLSYAGCSTIPADKCNTDPGGSLQREAFAATSHILTTTHVDLGTLLGQVSKAQGSGLLEAGISIDALGGAVRDVGASDTAFGHRSALATVQYTATYTGDSAAPATSYVRGFRKAMTPSWGTGAYVNYTDASIKNYRAAYFGPNASRLAQARATYDPDGFFTQPQNF
jgi:FAD/FMN-containing dehydrogenase